MAREIPREIQGAAALRKGIAVLSAVATAAGPVRFGELHEKTGLPKPTLHRILAALAADELIVLEPREKTYRLGVKLLEMASRTWAGFDLRRAAEADLLRLRDETGETVHLAVLDGVEVVYIDKIESKQQVRMYSTVGNRAPSYCTGVGKAILAFLAPQRQSEVIGSLPFKRYTDRTITSERKLKQHLAEARGRGFAVDEGEHEEGIRCVAAPILDYRGDTIGSISVSAPSFRFGEEKMRHFAPAVVAAAQRISRKAGAIVSAAEPQDRNRVGTGRG